MTVWPWLQKATAADRPGTKTGGLSDCLFAAIRQHGDQTDQSIQTNIHMGKGNHSHRKEVKKPKKEKPKLPATRGS